MSRYYNMSVTISGTDSARTEEIKAAARAEWAFEDWYPHEDALSASNDGYLAGGETEEEFTERLSKAIWLANGGFCTVEVTAIYLEELPYEWYCLDEEDYHRIVGTDTSSTPHAEAEQNP